VSKRAALVTGASSGIGLAIARALGEEGYVLTVSGRRAEKLESAAAGLRDLGFEVHAAVAEIGREKDVLALFAAHREAWGRLDVLVNNAGVGIPGTLDDLSADDLDRQLEVNLRAVILGTREGLPLLRQAGAEHGKALIVNTASIAGKSGQTRASVYAATKAAVLNFTESTSLEAGAAGIQCTALAPGWVDTPMAAEHSDVVPAEAMIKPEDIAEAVRFLLRTSANCQVPEIVFTQPGLGAAG